MARQSSDDVERAGEVAARLRVRFEGLALPDLVFDTLGLGVLLLAAWTPIAGLAAGTAVAAALFIVGVFDERFRRTRFDGGFRVARLLLCAAIAIAAPSSWVPATVIAVLVIAELPLSRAEIVARPTVANAAGTQHGRSLPGGLVLGITTGAAGIMSAMGLFGVSASWMWLPAAIAAGVVAVKAAADLLRIRQRHRDEFGIHGVLRALAPRFAVYWDGEPGMAYQLSMWLPILDRLDRPYFVVVRDPDVLEDVATLTDRPVLARIRHNDLDTMIVPTLAAAFYVNNALSNVNFVRYPEIWHLQLNHGDSDKAPSYNPSMRMYDRDFVAGAAAVERFAAHDVATRSDFFELVGRPQLAGVAAVPRLPNGSIERVLYAPTWAGFNADSAHSSLPFGIEIVQELLSRGLVVWFRPHPNTRLDPHLARSASEIRRLLRTDRARSGRGHVFDDPPQHDLVEMFNETDALVTDVSSVLSDYLASAKPYMVATMIEPVDGFRRGEAASAGYPFEPSPASLRSALDEMLAGDPRSPRRAELRTKVLGAGDADDAFRRAALRYVDSPKPHRVA